MALSMLGTKIGMTRMFTESGANVPVTVIQVGPCVVTQVKTPERDGYAAVQIGYHDAKPRRSPMPIIGHDAKAGAAPKRFHREFRVEPDEVETYTLGQELTVEQLEGLAFVDVIGTSKGKGFQGVMKRHNFAGLEASHGVERKHRSAGSIGGHATNLGTGPKPKKGKRMAGHMGAERVTVRSLDVISIDKEQGLLMVKGPVPGANKGMVEIRTPSRLYAPKARRQRETTKNAG
ncbi:MAG: 50S ribosomal protein L3 [Phycisphaeraceae bacterium]|nr:MAG: 50S ribosomal protein L3 [Phycisphaeraceae bacterium]